MTTDVNALQALDSEELEAATAKNSVQCTFTCDWTSW
ncbi:hypothetical protein P3T37_006344 [Kitasatospora sp. MAA4]|nr:ALQxL family class IV lanthipeptide [Kitasatospora sp. MAA4]MDH6136913.1 hypothetical protein [Kitasatospora sp. MAA4]